MVGNGWYDTAQICLNGHLINSMAVSNPQHNRNFCNECGQKTITDCPSCKTSIPGQYHDTGSGFAFSPFQIPKSCHNCGKPYPWTEFALEAAKEYADELEKLTLEEREKLKQSIDDLVKDTPKTQLAASRFKQLVTKAGGSAADIFQKVLVNIISETAKKLIWPS
jgi:hypothetical protein